jgi:hypothetical protein
MAEVANRRCRCCGSVNRVPGRTICQACIDANCLVPVGCNRDGWDDDDVEGTPAVRGLTT